MAVRQIGGGSSLPAVISEVNQNFLSLKSTVNQTHTVIESGSVTFTLVANATTDTDVTIATAGILSAQVWLVSGGVAHPLPYTATSISGGTIVVESVMRFSTFADTLNITAALKTAAAWAGSRTFYYEIYDGVIG